MKNKELDHSTLRVGLKMAWRCKIVRLDWLGGTNGDRAVRVDQRLREVSRNGSATIGS